MPPSSAPLWRRRLPLVGGVLLVLLIVIGLWPRAIPVESGVVQRGAMIVTVDEEGMTRVRNRYVVSAPVGGQLQRIDWKAGAPVVAGQTLLAVLESSGADFLDARLLAQAEARIRGAEAARDAAVAQRDRAAAAAKLAAAEFERARVLREQRVASAQEFDLAQMRADTAAQDARAGEFAVKVAAYELEQARALLTRGRPTDGGSLPPLQLTSPVDGRILRVFQESARVVPAGFPLLEIGDPTDLEVRIEVLSRDGVAIRPGARVLLERWGGDTPLNARVRLVEPSAFTKISALGVEEQRVYVIADFTDPVAQRPTLGDSYRVEARIVTWEKPDALHAPAGALFQRGGTWQTFVIDGGRARQRTVQIGRTNGVETEILSGLNPGDRLIVYPGDKVKEGTRVSPLVIEAR
ncbi:HlyD family efflux transporter periplasmic adaptor subunit [Opitutus sp. ER46]|uniref:efflux RND transporter periplasmic adaptor subunit n=1 Tax=Opitutus sp. ER46 TaxID=2161864 RepID=UPI000D32160B|nr:HlyD family efflux transporter periplasmic adaptor subunit [Opitutus sp. ER46]PTX91368.1 RND transporter [Opitutus sp. ER46]